MKKITTLLLFLCFGFTTGSFAQKSIYGVYNDSYDKTYIVKINPKNGSAKKMVQIKHITGFVAMGSAYDEVNGRYFLIVATSSGNYLDICNVNTGNVNKITLGTDSFPQFLQYDAVTSQLYGIIPKDGNFCVCSVDTIHGSYTRIGSYGTNGCTYSSFDHANGYYIMIGVTGGSHLKAMAMNVSNGNVVYNVSLDTLSGLNNASYNQADGKIYGTASDNTTGAEYFVSVDLTSGHFTTLNSINKLAGISFTDAAFDDINGRLTFYGIQKAGKAFLYTLDISTNSVLYQARIPNTIRINELHCDASASSSLTDVEVLGGSLGDATGNALIGATVYMYDNNGKAIDSMINDGYGDYMFSQPAGKYYICAVPPSTSVNQLSTYYGSTVSINNAKTISVSGDLTPATFNTMAAATPSTGSIKGEVMISQTCDGNPGNTPAQGVKLFLADNTGKPEYETISDGNGHFAFDAIALQSYQILIDNLAIDNSNAPAVILTSYAANKTGVNLNLCADKLAIANTSSGINNMNAGITEVHIYPNPFSSALNIEYQLSKDDQTDITITDLTGKEIYQNTKISDLAGLHNLSINSAEIGLKPGIYLVTFKTSLNTHTVKIVNL